VRRREFSTTCSVEVVTSVTEWRPYRIVVFILLVETEDQICRRFETELAAIAVLDRRYYSNLSPSVAERAVYAARQLQLERTRSRFYAELESSHRNQYSR
jgi:hypothetical protein